MEGHKYNMCYQNDAVLLIVNTLRIKEKPTSLRYSCILRSQFCLAVRISCSF
jgi:hypothetical protein